MRGRGNKSATTAWRQQPFLSLPCYRNSRSAALDKWRIHGLLMRDDDDDECHDGPREGRTRRTDGRSTWTDIKRSRNALMPNVTTVLLFHFLSARISSILMHSGKLLFMRAIKCCRRLSMGSIDANGQMCDRLFLFATLRRNIGTNSPYFPLAATRDGLCHIPHTMIPP